MKPRRSTARKQAKVPREIEAALKRDQRRQAQELLQRLASRNIYPDPEADSEYRP